MIYISNAHQDSNIKVCFQVTFRLSSASATKVSLFEEESNNNIIMCPTLYQTLTVDIFSRHKNIVEMSLLKRHDILSLSSFFDFKISIRSVLHYVLKSRMFVRMFAQGDEEIFL